MVIDFAKLEFLDIEDKPFKHKEEGGKVISISSDEIRQEMAGILFNINSEISVDPIIKAMYKGDSVEASTEDIVKLRNIISDEKTGIAGFAKKTILSFLN